MSENKDTFCALPWNHLATHPNGTVSLCCESVQKATKHLNHMILGKHSISEIFNSHLFTVTRMKMLKGEIPTPCQRCFDKEAQNASSKRLLENNLYKNFTLEKAKELTKQGGLIRPNIQFLEIRLGNLCNLKCRTCNYSSSFLWEKDQDSLKESLDFFDHHPVIGDFNWFKKQEVWDEIFEYSESLETIYINGGEPMLVKEHFTFLEKLVASGRSKNIKLVYSLNLTILPDMVFELWSKFKSVELRASLDDLRERNQYIRHPLKWDTALGNLKKIIDNKSDNVFIFIMQTVSAMNFAYLGEFFKFFKELHLHVGHNFVFNPDYLSPKALPLKLRRKYIEKSFINIDPQQSIELRNLFLDGVDYPDLTAKFLKFTEECDKLRGENFSEVFPELYSDLKDVTLQ